MSEPRYLLFIDKKPVHDDLKNYFTQFNIAIVQQKNLLPIDNKLGIPMAILIHCSVLNHELHIMNQLYTTYTVPLFVINDYPDEELCIKVLEAGADDFIIKPIYPRELHARVSAIRKRVLRAKQQEEQDKDVIVFTDWRLYPAARRIFSKMKNEELLLSTGEYDLLLAFVQNPQRALEREHLLQITKNSDLNPFDRRIDVQISRLRQKIEINAKKPSLIRTIRNGGYMFTAQIIMLKEHEIKE